MPSDNNGLAIEIGVLRVQIQNSLRHVLAVRFAANKKIEEHDFDSYASSSCLT